MEVSSGYKWTEIGPIPSSWDLIELEKICGQKITYGIVQCGPHVENGVPYIRVSDMNGRELDVSGMLRTDPSIAAQFSRSRVEKGDVVYALRGKIGEVRLVRSMVAGANLTQGTARLSPNNQVRAAYLLWGLRSQSSLRQAELAAKGSTFREITLADLRRIQLPIPPLCEQEAIAEALSDADALIESLERLIAKKRCLKLGAMQELLAGKRRLPGFEVKPGYKQSETGVIPKDWDLRPLLTAVRIAQGQVDPKVEPYKSMFLVGPIHVEPGTGKLLIRQTAAEQRAISGKYLFAKGDIVYGKINPYLQKAFLADFCGLCSADMYPLKPSGDVSSGFVLAVILGHQFTKYAECVSVRSGIPKINRVEMGGFIFPIPSDKAEQSAIAAIAFDMDEEMSAIEVRVAKARQLKQSMMQQLLTGKVRLV